jgi:hypothetical protein
MGGSRGSYHCAKICTTLSMIQLAHVIVALDYRMASVSSHLEEIFVVGEGCIPESNPS